MKTNYVLSLLILFGALGTAPKAASAELLGSYVALKGGVYSPSSSFSFSNLDLETSFDGDTETGVAGEIAIGRYVLPTLALELALGYFEGSGSFAATPPSAPRHEVDFNVVPILLTAKAFIPAGPVSPYGQLGIGAYFTSVDVSDNANSFSGDVTFGLHAGAGLNIYVTERVFIGFESRYVWADPSFGDEEITLNDDSYELRTFELNGFTTMVALGFGF